MRSLRFLLALPLALTLLGAVHCGAPQPAQRSSMDVEGGDSGDGGERPRARAHQAQPSAPAQIVALSLDGVPLLKKAEAAAGKEGDPAAQPEPGTVGPPRPPEMKEAEAKEAEAAEAAAQQPAGIALPPRNLFAFEEDPAVILDRQKKAEEAAARAAEAAQRAAEERQKQEEYLRLHPPPPQPPQITFQFIGYMGPPEERIGVFATPGILLARKGDTILGKFKVVNIGYESAEIGFTGFTQTQRIPLSAGGK